MEIEKSLNITKLNFKKDKDSWIVKDDKGRKRALINLSDPKIDHWSDLLPKPEETLDMVIYPDGDKEVKISAYDKFFPARQDAMALAFVENDKKPDRATISPTGLMVTISASVTSQLKVTLSPASMLIASAAKE